MASFYENLTAILNGRYGSEIRQPIFDCLDELNNQNTNSKTLTRAEYDALSETERNNGKVYYISDKGEIYKNGRKYGTE